MGNSHFCFRWGESESKASKTLVHSRAGINGVFHHGLIRTWPHTKQTQSITRKVNMLLPTATTSLLAWPSCCEQRRCLHNAQEITLHQPQQQWESVVANWFFFAAFLPASSRQAIFLSFFRNTHVRKLISGNKTESSSFFYVIIPTFYITLDT